MYDCNTLPFNHQEDIYTHLVVDDYSYKYHSENMTVLIVKATLTIKIIVI